MLKKLIPMLLLASTCQATEAVRIYNWSEYIAPDTMTSFQKATGIGNHYDVYDSNETLEAMPLKIDRLRTRIWSKVKSGI